MAEFDLPMLYAKAAGGGLLSALAAAAEFVAVKVGGPILYVQLVTLQRQTSGESSWDAYYPTRWNIVEPVVPAVIGFGSLVDPASTTSKISCWAQHGSRQFVPAVTGR